MAAACAHTAVPRCLEKFREIFRSAKWWAGIECGLTQFSGQAERKRSPQGRGSKADRSSRVGGHQMVFESRFDIQRWKRNACSREYLFPLILIFSFSFFFLFLHLLFFNILMAYKARSIFQRAELVQGLSER